MGIGEKLFFDFDWMFVFLTSDYFFLDMNLLKKRIRGREIDREKVRKSSFSPH